MRIGELAFGPHQMKAKDIHVAQNKDKILIVLYTSKTHGLNMKPQQIKITKNCNSINNISHFCPFVNTRHFMSLRGSYDTDNEAFFVFRDKSQVTSEHVRGVLRKCLENMGLNSLLYDFHSMRIGKATQLYKNGTELARIRFLGRWRSNAIYQYIKCACELG